MRLAFSLKPVVLGLALIIPLAAASSASAAPVITQFSPVTGPVGTVVTVTGTSLLGTTEVTFNGTPATTVTVLSGVALQARVPPGATTGRIGVTNRGGSAQSAARFKLLPRITGFLPASGIAGESVMVTGFNLQEGAVAPTARIGAVAAPVAQATPTSVQVTIPPTATSGRINVVTAAGLAVSPTALAVIRRPVVSAFEPASGPVGAVVTVTGLNLGGVTAVAFNGTPASALTVVSATSLRATVPPGATGGRILVTNRAGSVQSAAGFLVAPRITGFSPTIGVPGEAVTLSGFNLKAGAAVPVVRVTGVRAAVTATTLTSATFTIPAAAKSGRIQVVTAHGAAASGTGLVVLVPTRPQPQAFQPAAASEGTTIVVSGTGLSLSSQVTFAGSVTAVPTAVTPTSLQVGVPAGARTGSLVVTNPKGTGTSAAAFRVLPRITLVMPGAGVVGDAVTIVGTSLKVGSDHPEVRVGALQATVETSSAGSVVARIPGGARTGQVSVTTVDGVATSAGTLIVASPPVVESRLEKTTTRSGTAVERVVEVRFRPGLGDFHTVTVSDGVLLTDAPLDLHGGLVVGGRAVEQFSLRRALVASEVYPPADREFTVVATPASGGAPIVFRTTPGTLGSPDQLTIVEFDNPKITATPTVLAPIVGPTQTVAGRVEGPTGTAIEVFGCRGAGCSFTSLGVTTASGPLWFLTIPAALAPGDRVKARALAPGKFTSLDSSTVTVLASGQLNSPTVLGPIAARATGVFGVVAPGTSVEVFVRTPSESSLGFADVFSSPVWAIDGLSPLLPGQEVFAIARQAGVADSPPSEPVVVAAPAPIARFDFTAVANVRVTVGWDTDGLTSPIRRLRLSAAVANADETLVCQVEEEIDALAGPLPNAVEVVLTPQCVGTGGAQPAAIGRICVDAIDDQGRQTDHCLVFD